MVLRAFAHLAVQRLTRHSLCTSPGIDREERMARISRIAKRGQYRVSIQGPLSVRDLGRLERACGRALEEREPRLEICLKRVDQMDEAARIFLQRLSARGVLIHVADQRVRGVVSKRLPVG